MKSVDSVKLLKTDFQRNVARAVKIDREVVRVTSFHALLKMRKTAIGDEGPKGQVRDRHRPPTP